MDEQSKRLRGGVVEVCPECDIAGCRHIRARAAQAQPDAGLDVEAVLRRFLTGDGFIAECDIQHIVAALTAKPAISGYTCTVPDDCETLHWRGQILSMNELASVGQPAAGEEIMVNAPGDVYTLPMQPSGLTSGPRFVVHVPAQPAAPDWATINTAIARRFPDDPANACRAHAAIAEVLRAQPAASADEACDHSEHVRPADGVCVECGEQVKPAASVHPIPQRLREAFSAIEDAAHSVSGMQVFTQMRTAVQSFFQAQPAASAEPSDALSENEWYDLAQRHATRDWNGNGYMAAIQAVCLDFLSRYGRPAGDAQPVIKLESKHPDDLAVDSFACAMKDKLALARAKGRSGWQGCDPADLSRMLREHVEKGDPRDVANFCMFLWNKDQPIAAPVAAQKADDARDADMFWDANDPERFSASDLQGAVEYIMDEYSPSDLPMELDLLCARSMPNVQVRVTGYNEADGWQYEVVDAAIAQQRKGSDNG